MIQWIFNNYNSLFKDLIYLKKLMKLDWKVIIFSQIII